MKCITILILFSLKSLTSSLQLGKQYVRGDEPKFLGLTRQHRRQAEWHKVMTEDGHILSLFRIPPNPAFHKKRQNPRVIYLQHGLQAASDIFILFGPGRSLAYLLSDAGYDVWLGNLRGTHYSLGHRKYSTDDSEFWDFSMDEYALLDLPAMLNYIIGTTGQRQLAYIGHSLGTTVLLMLLADKPEYNYKLTVAVLLAPVAYWKDRNLLTSAGAISSPLMDIFVPGAMKLPSGASSIALDIFERNCVQNPIISRLCKTPGRILNQAVKILPAEEEVFLLRHYLAGASIKVQKQYAQHMRSGNLEHYNFGTKASNLRAYGQVQPPEYNLENIRTPMILFRAPNDPFSTEFNVNSLLEHLPRDLEVQSYVVPEVPFGHRDFLVAKSVQKAVYEPLLTILNEFYESRRNN